MPEPFDSHHQTLLKDKVFSKLKLSQNSLFSLNLCLHSPTEIYLNVFVLQTILLVIVPYSLATIYAYYLNFSVAIKFQVLKIYF